MGTLRYYADFYFRKPRKSGPIRKLHTLNLVDGVDVKPETVASRDEFIFVQGTNSGACRVVRLMGGGLFPKKKYRVKREKFLGP